MTARKRRISPLRLAILPHGRDSLPFGPTRCAHLAHFSPCTSCPTGAAGRAHGTLPTGRACRPWHWRANARVCAVTATAAFSGPRWPDEHRGRGLVLHLPWVDRRLGRPLPWRPTAASGEGSTRADTHNLHFMEYLGSVDDALFTELIEDWIAGNPPELSTHGAMVGAPTISPFASPSGLRRSPGGMRTAPFAAPACRILPRAQLRFLTRHLESDLRGNHLIKNIRALAWGGACFVGPEADRWTELARVLLREELAEQILPDGCHYERSPAYHCQVMSDLLACRAALRQPLMELDRALDRMAAVLPCYTHPDGQIAPWNDGGLTMAPTPGRLASVHAELGGRPAEAPQGPFALPDGGYFGMRAPDELVIVDCGQLGPPYLPGHGHCDLLSFEWSIGGRRIVVDQGTHQYVAGPRRWTTRCTASHNTLAVMGGEQSDIYGAFRCGRRARPELRSFAADGSGFRLEGTHDGYHIPGRSAAAHPSGGGATWQAACRGPAGGATGRRRRATSSSTRTAGSRLAAKGR